MSRSPTETELRCAAALRAECLKVFGSAWDNDVALRFVRAVIQSLEPCIIDDVESAILDAMEHSIQTRTRGEPLRDSLEMAWRAGIKAASPKEKT